MFVAVVLSVSTFVHEHSCSLAGLASSHVKHSHIKIIYRQYRSRTTAVADPGQGGGHPNRAPPSASSNFFQVNEIISYGCASSARLLIFNFFILRITRNGQWAMTIHSVTLVLLKIEVLIQKAILGTRPFTLYSERLQWTHSRTHMSVWYYTSLYLNALEVLLYIRRYINCRS